MQNEVENAILKFMYDWLKPIHLNDYQDIVATIKYNNETPEVVMLTYSSYANKKHARRAIQKGDKVVVNGGIVYECIEVYQIVENNLKLYLVK